MRPRRLRVGNSTATTGKNMRIIALLVFGLVAGCGAPRTILYPEQADIQALRKVESFQVKPVRNEFAPDPAWGIERKEWTDTKLYWNAAVIKEFVESKGRRFYELPPSTEAKQGAIVEIEVLDIDIGNYAFFSYRPAKISAVVTITDAQTKKMLYKAKAQGETSGGGGWETTKWGSRTKFAHLDVVWAILEMIGNEKP